MTKIENNFIYKKNISNLKISFERIAFIFFIFFLITAIFSTKTIYLGLKKTTPTQILKKKKNIEDRLWIEMEILLPKLFVLQTLV